MFGKSFRQAKAASKATRGGRRFGLESLEERAVMNADAPVDPAGDMTIPAEIDVIGQQSAPLSTPQLTGKTNFEVGETIVLHGTASAGSRVDVYVVGVMDDNGDWLTDSAVADENGEWTAVIDADLPRDRYSLGIQSSYSSGERTVTFQRFTVGDFTPPLQPTFDSRSEFWAHETVLLSGSGEPGSQITLRLEQYNSNGGADALQKSGTVGADGRWSFDFGKINGGDWTATIKASDDLGNTSETIIDLKVNVDSTPPSVPQLTGAKEFDFGKPVVLTGVGEAGSRIDVYFPHVFDQNGDWYKLSTTADANGKWSVQANLEQVRQSYLVAIYSTDAAGNTAQTNASIRIGDFTPPPPPVYVGPTSFVTSKPIVLTGMGEAGSTISIYLGNNSNSIGQVKVGADGKWSFIVPPPVGSQLNGLATFRFVDRDAAGNESVLEQELSFLKSLTPILPVSPLTPTLIDAVLASSLR